MTKLPLKIAALQVRVTGCFVRVPRVLSGAFAVEKRRSFSRQIDIPLLPKIKAHGHYATSKTSGEMTSVMTSTSMQTQTSAVRFAPANSGGQRASAICTRGAVRHSLAKKLLDLHNTFNEWRQRWFTPDVQSPHSERTRTFRSTLVLRSSAPSSAVRSVIEYACFSFGRTRSLLRASCARGPCPQQRTAIDQHR